MGRERSLVLTEADRARLQGWSRRRKTAGPGTALTHHPALREWLDGDGPFLRTGGLHPDGEQVVAPVLRLWSRRLAG
jgi:hypothetical protein